MHLQKKSKLTINESKSEVMVFNFTKEYAFPPDLTIGESDLIREVTVTKLLGVMIQSDLGWQQNTEYICKRATGKLWILRWLKHLNVETEYILDVYLKEVRSLLELAVPVWNSGLILKQSNTIERVQWMVVSIMFGEQSLSYTVYCTLLGIEPLFMRRSQLSLSFAKKTAHKWRHTDLLEKRLNTHNTRSGNNEYKEHHCRTKRCFQSPLPHLARELNKHITRR